MKKGGFGCFDMNYFTDKGQRPAIVSKVSALFCFCNACDIQNSKKGKSLLCIIASFETNSQGEKGNANCIFSLFGKIRYFLAFLKALNLSFAQQKNFFYSLPILIVKPFQLGVKLENITSILSEHKKRKWPPFFLFSRPPFGTGIDLS